MIEALTQLKPQSMISIDDELSKQFTACEDFIVDSIERFNVDGVDVVILTLGEFYLFAHNITSNIQFTICEAYDDGAYYIDIDEDDFVEEVELETGEDISLYQRMHTIYSLDDNPSFAEFSCHDAYFTNVIVQKSSDDLIIYRGIAVEPANVIL